MNLEVEPRLDAIFYFSPPDRSFNRLGPTTKRRLFFNTVSSLVRAKVAGEWTSDSTRIAEGVAGEIEFGIGFGNGFRVVI